MQTFFVMIASLWQRVFDLLDKCVFTFNIYNQTIKISLTMILLSFLVFSVIISVFWRGARA